MYSAKMKGNWIESLYSYGYTIEYICIITLSINFDTLHIQFEFLIRVIRYIHICMENGITVLVW